MLLFAYLQDMWFAPKHFAHFAVLCGTISLKKKENVMLALLYTRLKTQSVFNFCQIAFDI
jgi:hypothetical protein